MPTITFHKTTVLPGNLAPNAMYLVAPAAQPNALEVYMTDNAGAAARVTLRRSEVQTMVDAAIAAGGGAAAVFADTIADRDAISNPQNAMSVFVLNAAADPTVGSGWATYIYRASNQTWIKTGENESMDLVLDWTRIIDGPVSTAALIDAAVGLRHSHTNMTQLEKVGEDEEGQFTYGGQRPRTPLENAAW